MESWGQACPFTSSELKPLGFSCFFCLYVLSEVFVCLYISVYTCSLWLFQSQWRPGWRWLSFSVALLPYFETGSHDEPHHWFCYAGQEISAQIVGVPPPTLRGFLFIFFLIYIDQLRFSRLCNKHFIDWAVSSALHSGFSLEEYMLAHCLAWHLS